MSLVRNRVRRGAYIDSVALMRVAQQVKALPGVEEAGLMIGTPANREILADAGLMADDGRAAGPGDLIIAVRAMDIAAADAALAHAERVIDQGARPATGDAGTSYQPRTLRTAHALMPDANMALISVPGDFAAAEAEKALARGLNVMIFSDNVPLADEIALKRRARDLGLLVMGPDCGTAIIAGVPLAFANSVPRGDIGIVGASGTGIQEISCLIARLGGGVSHAIGTGGRDLHADVGGITTLMGIDLLERDPATRHIVLVSKPPAEAVARAILARVGKAGKPFTICFLGSSGLALPANAHAAATLEAAAYAALGRQAPEQSATALGRPDNGGRMVRGLFSGGTLCAEAQIVARGLALSVSSNAPVPGAVTASAPDAHRMIDLGADEFTRGRPHPMLEPAVRDAPLRDALADASVGVILLDVVLGTGGHHDPAGHLARMLSERPAKGPHVVASITGTAGDRQGLAAQTRALKAAGVVVAPSNAAAARLAFAAVGARKPD